MKTNLLFLALLLLNIVAYAQSVQLVHDGILRSYLIYEPPGYNPAVATPLVINYHGLDSDAFQQRFYTLFDQIAADSNFIVIYPSGVNNAWNSGLVTQSTADDVGFTGALIDHVSASHNIDQRRVYATGMSNGGLMAYRLACELEDRIAAIGSVTGALAEDIVSSCQNTRAVPVIQIHGTADAIVSYGGLPGFHRGAEGSINHFINLNNCNTVGDTTPVQDVNVLDNSTAERIYYGPCDDGTEVELYKVFNGGHTWPGASIAVPINGNTNFDFSASRTIWDFFSRHILPLNTNTESLDESSLQVTLFPVPFSDELFITTDYKEQLQVTVTDLLGKTLVNDHALNGSTKLNLSELAAGVYFVTLSNEHNQVTRKVVKQ